MTADLARVDEVTLNRDLNRMRNSLTQVQQKVIPVAASGALNKTGPYVVRGTRKQLAGELNISQKSLKGRIAVQNRAKVRRLIVVVRGRFHQLSYSKVGTLRDTRGGVSVGRRGVIGGIGNNKTFRATVSHGHQGAFARKTRKRLPIKEIKLSLNPQGRTLLNRISQGPARPFFVREFEKRVDAALTRRGLK